MPLSVLTSLVQPPPGFVAAKFRYSEVALPRVLDRLTREMMRAMGGGVGVGEPDSQSTSSKMRHDDNLM